MPSKSKASAVSDKALAVFTDEYIEAQRNALRSILYSVYEARERTGLAEALAYFTGKNLFTDALCKACFNALIDTRNSQSDIVLDALPDAIKAHGVSKITAENFIVDIRSISPVFAANIKYCADRLKDYALRHEARIYLLQAADEALSRNLSISQLSSDLQAQSELLKAESSQINGIDVNDFLNMKLPEKKPLLGKDICEKDRTLIFATAGCGKTYLMLFLSVAIATGSKVWSQWDVAAPRRVLYCDGEMGSNVMQERIAMLCNGFGKRPEQGYLTVITPDLLGRAKPDLATEEGRASVEAIVRKADIVVVDNLSCMFSVDDENSAAQWRPYNDWLTRLRTQGKTVFTLHHSGKNHSNYRGSSAIIATQENVIGLEKAEHGKIKVSWHKHRNLSDMQALPFLLSFRQDGDSMTLEREELPDTERRKEQILALAEQGLTQAEIGKKLCVNQGTVSRILKGQK